MKTILVCLPALFALSAACAHREPAAEPVPEPVRLVEIDTIVHGLVIYYPPTDSIELRCFERPDPKADGSIVFCCAAAFTADFGTKADHDRICGDHVSGGVFYQRPRLRRNTGAFFVGKDGRYAFMYSAGAKQEIFRPEFERAVTGFTQEMLIRRSERVRTTRPDKNANVFRALCLTAGGRLCVIDSAEPMQFGHFIELLRQAGVYDALYMEHGPRLELLLVPGVRRQRGDVHPLVAHRQRDELAGFPSEMTHGQSITMTIKTNDAHRFIP